MRAASNAFATSAAVVTGSEQVCPTQMKAAHNHYAAMTNGFGSYSDGVHDDLNKAVWSALAWDPNADLDAILPTLNVAVH